MPTQLANKYEFRQSLRSHSWSVSLFLLYMCPTEQHQTLPKMIPLFFFFLFKDTW